MKLWGGRFNKDQNELMKEFNSSFGFDKRLIFEDIKGSIAHARMLKKIGVFSDDEFGLIDESLNELIKQIRSCQIEVDGDFEDVHTFVENFLVQKLGDLGKKIHTARSRNDQVALDMRLYLKNACNNVIDYIEALRVALSKKGAENPYLMPGFTHLQPAQIITFKYYLSAYNSMLQRDKKRLINAIDNMDKNPLGSCALAGTTHDIDMEYTSDILGFIKPVDNFIDGVSDRDFVIEVLAALSILMMHLSRLCEDLIIYSSNQFRFITINDQYSTGSSIMPQKKNPDSLELIRGKTGRVYGDLVALLTTMKALPLAYNKDMQEDKEPVFDAIDTVIACIRVMKGVIETLKVNKDEMLISLNKGFINATEVADYLVKKGVAFRSAHEIVGRIVLFCEEKNRNIHELSIEELKKFSELFDNDIYPYIDYFNIVNKGIKKAML
ncbi:Argininosuccinate lyase [Caloramator mitchellensis]|uniref:Argininosuccinate lyase n=1 Tax=Caloramator mitchellensis TaxID=908809 RepID=A0A0R3JV44_CALMK|nr:argininosuccinate lyase [Caloramator mitchellensis]KRQ87446.1 Argininosuccinate lyase [Caloramator mitchellensis]